MFRLFTRLPINILNIIIAFYINMYLIEEKDLNPYKGSKIAAG